MSFATEAQLDRSTLDRFENSDAYLTIMPSTVGNPDLETDDECRLGGSLVDRIRKSPEQCHGVVQCWDFDKRKRADWTISVDFCLPEARFEKVMLLAKVLLSSPRSLQLFAWADVIGFRSEHASTDTPTPDEFLNGKGHFFDECRFWVKQWIFEGPQKDQVVER